VRVNGIAFQVLAGRVDHCHFTAGAKTGIDAHDDLAAHGRPHQQRAQIGAEHTNRMVAGPLGQARADFTLDGRGDQAMIAVLDGAAQIVGENRAGVVEMKAFKLSHHLCLRRIDPDSEKILPLAAIDRQDAMGRHRLDRFAEGLVKLIIARLLRIDRFGFEHAGCQRAFPYGLAALGILGNHLRHDIPGAGQRLFGS